MKIYEKTLKEYVWSIRYYILCSILLVISQYIIIGLPLTPSTFIRLPEAYQRSWLINLTQILWELMVALSVIKLVKRHDFNMKNVFFMGIIYSVIIHGLKISIRYFFYGKDFWYLLHRFLYGSFLVMLVAIPLGLIVIHLKKKPWKIEKKSIIDLIISLIIALLIVWIITKLSLTGRIYNLLRFNR